MFESEYHLDSTSDTSPDESSLLTDDPMTMDRKSRSAIPRGSRPSETSPGGSGSFVPGVPLGFLGTAPDASSVEVPCTPSKLDATPALDWSSGSFGVAGGGSGSWIAGPRAGVGAGAGAAPWGGVGATPPGPAPGGPLGTHPGWSPFEAPSHHHAGNLPPQPQGASYGVPPGGLFLGGQAFQPGVGPGGASPASARSLRVNTRARALGGPGSVLSTPRGPPSSGGAGVGNGGRVPGTAGTAAALAAAAQAAQLSLGSTPRAHAAPGNGGGLEELTEEELFSVLSGSLPSSVSTTGFHVPPPHPPLAQAQAQAQASGSASGQLQSSGQSQTGASLSSDSGDLAAGVPVARVGSVAARAAAARAAALAGHALPGPGLMSGASSLASSLASSVGGGSWTGGALAAFAGLAAARSGSISSPAAAHAAPVGAEAAAPAPSSLGGAGAAAPAPAPTAGGEFARLGSYAQAQLQAAQAHYAQARAQAQAQQPYGASPRAAADGPCAASPPPPSPAAALSAGGAIPRRSSATSSSPPPTSPCAGPSAPSVAAPGRVARPSPTPPPRWPLTPAQALEHYGHLLAPYERTEILSYPEVWFLGRPDASRAASKVSPSGGDPLGVASSPGLGGGGGGGAGAAASGGLGAVALPAAEASPSSRSAARRARRGWDTDRGEYVVSAGDHLCYRYEVETELGRGSFGVVLRCRDWADGGRPAAVKVMRSSRRLAKQAAVEGSILSRLAPYVNAGQASIVRSGGAFSFRGHLCVSFEVLALNLYEHLQERKMVGCGEGAVRRVAEQVLGALRLLATLDVVHCDVKPENLMLVDRGRLDVRLIDFGSACYREQQVYSYVQSRFYRAPEVILGQRYGPPIDAWSLACVASELRTGYPLFPGEDEHQQLAYIVEVIGRPPRDFLAQCSRANLFFDALGNPLPCLVTRSGKRATPGGRPLESLLAAHQPSAAFLAFLKAVLRWDPAERPTAAQLLQHEWIADLWR